MERLVLAENGCWLYTGSCSPAGYGRIYDNGRDHVHRVTFRHFRGSIPEGLQIDHLCRVRHCANPWHMEPVTPAENVLRGEGITAKQARQTHCKRGHSLEDAYVYRGMRHCRICKKDRKEAWLADAANRERERERHRNYRARMRASG